MTEIVNFDEYYKRKNEYENEINKYKNRLRIDSGLSRREKAKLFKQFKPKCILCNEPGGTIFKIIYDEQKSTRLLTATCGHLVKPCNLSIQINSGKYESYTDVIDFFGNEIKLIKNDIIQKKSESMFGLVPLDDTLQYFDIIKSKLSDDTINYEYMLNEYFDKFDSKTVTSKLETQLELSYITINQIKENIDSFNTTNEKQYVIDAVDLYISKLTPTLKQVMDMKYSKSFVSFDEDTYIYTLNQYKRTLADMEVDVVEAAVVRNDTVLKRTGTSNSTKKANTIKNNATRKTKRKLIVEESPTPEIIVDTIKTAAEPILEPVVNDTSVVGVPTINEDDATVTWSTPEYQRAWDTLNDTYKYAVLLEGLLNDNNDWLQDVIDVRVRLLRENRPMEFVRPRNLNIPPVLENDGKYRFNNDSYDEAFNKLTKSKQTDLLNLSKTELENQMDNLMKQTLKFNPNE